MQRNKELEKPPYPKRGRKEEESEEEEEGEEEEGRPERTQDASAMLLYTLPPHVPSS